MIEQAMYFLLGALVAGLLGLMILPVLWRRAVRLSTRRLEMQIPLSMEEVLAERDLLRAEFAVTQAALERKLEAEREARVRERGELGRKSADLILREESLAEEQAKLARTEAQLAREREAHVQAQAEIGALRRENKKKRWWRG